MEGEEKKRGTSKQTLAFILPQRNRKEKKQNRRNVFRRNYFLYYLRPSLIKIQPWIFLLCYFTLFEIFVQYY